MSNDEDVIEVGMGLFNVFRQRDGAGNEGAGATDLEYRFERKFYYVGFAFGGTLTVDGSAFVYLENYADIRINKLYFLTLVLSMGA